MIRFKTLFDFQTEWTDQTFGALRSPIGPLSHLREEVDEAIEDLVDLEEMADCLLLIIDAAHCSGYNSSDLLLASFQKLEKNRKRQWGNPDKNGVVHHIK